MMTSKLTKLVAAAGAAAFTGWAGQAYALEGSTPFMPGVTVGTPIGVLPPAGVYGSDDNVIINGGLKSGNGSSRPANDTAYVNIPSVLWSPGINILGATYAAAIAQPYVMQNLNLTGVGGGQSIEQGLFNTIVSPINLSWNFHPLFFKVGLAIYADDGYTSSAPVPGGRVNNGIANDFWTFEPDVAVTYLENGWDFTANFVFDFNTTNNTTHYSSGDVAYVDLTAAKNVGKWVLGVGGDVEQQFTKDTGFGAPANGDEQNRVILGPLVGYNFGPAELDFKALFDVHAENTFGNNYYHLSASFPF